MKQRKTALIIFSLIGITMILLAGCNMPADSEESIQQTSAAQTEAASPQEQPTETLQPTATEPAGGEDPTATTTSESNPTATQVITPSSTAGGGEIGEDRAEFIADVTIPDYTQVKTGETITKTWRVRNSGTTTWTTDYVIEFEKGEKLGAATQIKLPKAVQPNTFIDISIEFTVPNAAGEYSSYWILKNAEGQKIGVAEEGKTFSMFMIIQAVSDTGDGGSSDPGGITGGAKITGATVSVDDASFTGSCPAELNFTYTVTTSNAGKVNFGLSFGVVSPAGYTFDPPPEYTVNFTGGYTVTYTYTLFSSNSVSATVKVEAVGSNTFSSAPLSFRVNCN